MVWCGVVWCHTCLLQGAARIVLELESLRDECALYAGRLQLCLRACHAATEASAQAHAHAHAYSSQARHVHAAGQHASSYHDEEEAEEAEEEACCDKLLLAAKRELARNVRVSRFVQPAAVIGLCIAAHANGALQPGQVQDESFCSTPCRVAPPFRPCALRVAWLQVARAAWPPCPALPGRDLGLSWCQLPTAAPRGVPCPVPWALPRLGGRHDGGAGPRLRLRS